MHSGKLVNTEAFRAWLLITQNINVFASKYHVKIFDLAQVYGDTISLAGPQRRCLFGRGAFLYTQLNHSSPGARSLQGTLVGKDNDLLNIKFQKDDSEIPEKFSNKKISRNKRPRLRVEMGPLLHKCGHETDMKPIQ